MTNVASSSHTPNFHGLTSGHHLLCGLLSTLTDIILALLVFAPISKLFHVSVSQSNFASFVDTRRFELDLEPEPEPDSTSAPELGPAAEPEAEGSGDCTTTVLKGIHPVDSGNGRNISPRRERGFKEWPIRFSSAGEEVEIVGGKTLTVSEAGGLWPFWVGGAENSKRTRCLGMFQFFRPLD